MTKSHALYYSKYCFFCQKVLRFFRGNDINIELRNTSDRAFVQWMYESDDIIRYFS